MGIYNDWVLPHVLNKAMAAKELAEQRRLTLSEVEGTVLELGFGSGHNLPFYPDAVERLVAIDPSATSAKLARKRIEAAPFPVEYRKLTGERLDAPDETFDAVVSTYTLCTVGDPIAALEQVQRVLKPGGSFYLLEHGLADDPNVRRWQARMNGFSGLAFGGCTLTRNIELLVRQAGFEFEKLDKYYLEGNPKFAGWLTRGVAKRASAAA